MFHLLLLIIRFMIFETTSIQMPPDHLGQRMDKQIERRFVFFFFSLGHFMNHLIDMLRDILRILRPLKNKVAVFSMGIEHYVALMEKRIPEGIVGNLRPFDIMVIDRDNLSGKYIPIDIHYSVVRDQPNIIIPVKNLINEVQVEEYGIDFESVEWNNGLEIERIVVIEKRWEQKTKKESDDDTVDDQKRMAVAHEKKFISLVDILLEENLIKVIHGENTLQLIRAVYIFLSRLQIESNT